MSTADGAMGPVEARICLAARAATWVRELYRARRVRGIRNAQISAARGIAESVAGTAITVNSVLPGPTKSHGVVDFVAALP